MTVTATTTFVGTAVRRLRDERRWTALDLVHRLQPLGGDLSRQAISKIETGARGVSIDELCLLARALDVQPVDLLPFDVREMFAGPPPKMIYALTLRGDEKHVYMPAVGEYGLPVDAKAVCGKLVRFALRDQEWADRVPACEKCTRRTP